MEPFSAAFRGHMDGIFTNEWEALKDGRELHFRCDEY